MQWKGSRVWATSPSCVWGVQVLADFRAGKFNTLVATCIGEEGLDIPQVRQGMRVSSSVAAAGQAAWHACVDPVSADSGQVRDVLYASKPHQQLLPHKPQVDMIVCYDASASPGRNIQRMGRTGRHGNGRVVYVLAAGKETEKYSKSLAVRPQPAALLWALWRYMTCYIVASAQSMFSLWWQTQPCFQARHRAGPAQARS